MRESGLLPKETFWQKHGIIIIIISVVLVIGFSIGYFKFYPEYQSIEYMHNLFKDNSKLEESCKILETELKRIHKEYKDEIRTSDIGSPSLSYAESLYFEKCVGNK